MIKLEDIKVYHDDIAEYYKTIHQNPELGLMEFETGKYVANKLREFNIEVIENVVRTGVIGILKGTNNGKTVALRADMDALPIEEETGLEFSSKNKGIMHACGHDAHTAMLLGAAKYLSNHRDLINGTIKFIFQPGEEGIAEEAEPMDGEGAGGAYYVVREGHLKDVDGCFAIHVNPEINTGEIFVNRNVSMASTDMFTIIINGKSGHGAAPESAIDPIPALSEILSACNMLPSREMSPLEPCVVSVGTVNTISSFWNIIPGKVEITGTFRTFDAEVRETINTRLKEIAENICKAHRCKGEYIRDKGYYPTVNDENMSKLAVSVGNQCLGEGKAIMKEKPSTGGEDVGEYFKVVPGALIWMGCKKPDNKEITFLHNSKMIVDLDALDVGVMLHVNNAISFLNN